MLHSRCLLSQSFSGQGLLHTFPSGRITKLLLLKLGFTLMEHQGTENYSSLKETDFGLKTAGGILTLTERSTPNTKMASFLHNASQVWENLLGALITPYGLPPQPGPSGFARCKIPSWQGCICPWATQCSAPRGSQLSLVIDKLKHGDIFNRPFVNTLPCHKLPWVPPRSIRFRG